MADYNTSADRFNNIAENSRPVPALTPYGSFSWSDLEYLNGLFRDRNLSGSNLTQADGAALGTNTPSGSPPDGLGDLSGLFPAESEVISWGDMEDSEQEEEDDEEEDCDDQAASDEHPGQDATSTGVPLCFERQPIAVQQRIDGLIRDLTASNPATVQAAQTALMQYGHAAAERLVERLNNDSFRMREAAYRQLQRMGADAVPALYSAIDNADPRNTEARLRARTILNEVIADRNSPAVFRDSQNRVRLALDPDTRSPLMEASYNQQGQLTRANYMGALAFNRQPDGTYRIDRVNATYTNVSISSDGNLSYQIPGIAGRNELTLAGETRHYGADGNLETITRRDGTVVRPNGEVLSRPSRENSGPINPNARPVNPPMQQRRGGPALMGPLQVV